MRSVFLVLAVLFTASLASADALQRCPLVSGGVIIAHLPAGYPIPGPDGLAVGPDGTVYSYPLTPEWFDFPAVADEQQEITVVNPDGTTSTNTVTISGARWPGKDSGWTVVPGGATGSKPRVQSPSCPNGRCPTPGQSPRLSQPSCPNGRCPTPRR